MRILGVDFGASRTGIAVSDILGMMAHGVTTVHSKSTREVAQRTADYAKEYSAGKIIVGLPKNMNNTIGERGEASVAFAGILKQKTDCEIILWDERLSTVSATRVLNETNTKGAKRKAVIDTVAAEIILQNYLDFIMQNAE